MWKYIVTQLSILLPETYLATMLPITYEWIIIYSHIGTRATVPNLSALPNGGVTL